MINGCLAIVAITALKSIKKRLAYSFVNLILVDFISLLVIVESNINTLTNITVQLYKSKSRVFTTA